LVIKQKLISSGLTLDFGSD